jgi:hypothetical protein
MTRFIRPRWRKPAAAIAAGGVFAAAWAVRGGRYWWLFVVLAVVATAARAFTFYLWAGEDDDLGALAGSRADERQLISLRSRALACNLTALAAFTGLTAAVALSAAWWWPFAVILAVTGVGYLFGLSAYGIAREGTADDTSTGTGHQAPTPASQ